VTTSVGLHGIQVDVQPAEVVPSAGQLSAEQQGADAVVVETEPEGRVGQGETGGHPDPPHDRGTHTILLFDGIKYRFENNM
jgi:hypothetical protein